MKKLTYLILCIGLMISCKSHDVKVMTYNIRLNTPNDGENAWPNRSGFLTAQILESKASIIGVQEALPDQIQDMQRLMPDFAYIGIGRDANSSGEYSAIFYRNNQYEVANANTFWLSKTPSVVSKDWDAAYPRICTYGLFTHKKSGDKFWVFNTHFDHVGATSRIESAKVILGKIQEVNTNNLPVIFMGDLNVEPDDAVIKVLEQQLIDTMMTVDGPLGPTATFNGFNASQESTRRIDYIFISKDIEQNVKAYKVLKDVRNDRYPSDHFPVWVQLKLN